MRRTTMLWEVFVRRFEEAFEQYKRHRLTGEEAASCWRCRGATSSGCAFAMRRPDRGLARPADRQGVVAARAGARVRADARALPGALPRLHGEAFHEQLVRRHGYKLCYTVTRLSLQAAAPV